MAFAFGSLCAQNVFTVVYATSDDGFVNVRSQPSNSGRILSKVYAFSHGLGSGVLRGQSGGWSKVSVGGVTGWAYSRYLGRQTWYTGRGRTRLVASAANAPIFTESYRDGSKERFTTVPRGTIIADEYGMEGGYYVLRTAHDNLFIRKADAREVRR